MIINVIQVLLCAVFSFSLQCSSYVLWMKYLCLLSCLVYVCGFVNFLVVVVSLGNRESFYVFLFSFGDVNVLWCGFIPLEKIVSMLAFFLGISVTMWLFFLMYSSVIAANHRIADFYNGTIVILNTLNWTSQLWTLEVIQCILYTTLRNLNLLCWPN